MACKNICKLCPRFIISTGVSLDTSGNIVITIPAGSYVNNQKYCLVIAQSIPAGATISAQVFVQPVGSANTYPLVRRNCKPATACTIKTRTKYSTVVETTAASGIFRMCGNACCTEADSLASIS